MTLSVTNVKSRWVAGNLEFLDRSGDIIATWNGSDRTFDVALPGILNIQGTPINADATEMSTLLHDPGRLASGRVRFVAAGDCDSVDVDGVVYAREAAPDITLGQWTEGANEGESATNLAAAINGDERNNGGPYYDAIANTNTVNIFAIDVGVGGNGDVDRVGGAQPAATENMVGGANPGIKQTTMITKVVSAEEDTANIVHIPTPFTPVHAVVEVRSDTGVLKAITDLVTIEANPDRIQIVDDGGVNFAATDVITAIIQE